MLTDVLAVYRLTRLVTKDEFPPVKAARDHVLASPDLYPDSAASFVECPWCVSFWVAGGVLAARRIAPRWWSVLSWMLAASAVAGLIQTNEGE